jgi:hypothetical protein
MIKLSKDDIGRVVILRNGDRARIARWRDNSRKPCIIQNNLGKQYCCWTNGSILLGTEGDNDVVRVIY